MHFGCMYLIFMSQNVLFSELDNKRNEIEYDILRYHMMHINVIIINLLAQ